MVEELTDTNFKTEIEKTSGLVVVDFHAPWCGPCQMFGPIFEEVSKQYDDVKFVKVNTQEAQQVASEAGVMSIPTIVFIKDGREVERVTGLMDAETLKSKVDSLKNDGDSE